MRLAAVRAARVTPFLIRYSAVGFIGLSDRGAVLRVMVRLSASLGLVREPEQKRVYSLAWPEAAWLPGCSKLLPTMRSLGKTEGLLVSYYRSLLLLLLFSLISLLFPPLPAFTLSLLCLSLHAFEILLIELESSSYGACSRAFEVITRRAIPVTHSERTSTDAATNHVSPHVPCTFLGCPPSRSSLRSHPTSHRCDNPNPHIPLYRREVP